MSNEIKILGLNIFDRVKEAGLAQQILTKYAHLIKTRLGFHEVTEDVCSRNAIILLQLLGEPEECEKLESELLQIGGVEVQHMSFKF
ncbi:MAG: hypothetical protein Q8880_05905 [Bacteroidota bacterium]|nr:hypothetical protein [Bacteroidota bacterium]